MKDLTAYIINSGGRKRKKEQMGGVERKEQKGGGSERAEGVES
jgi:hypothetical protein